MSQSKRLPIESCMRLFWPLLPAGEWHRPTWNKKQKHHTPAREGFCCCCCRSHKHQKCHHIGYATAEGSPFSETALERHTEICKANKKRPHTHDVVFFCEKIQQRNYLFESAKLLLLPAISITKHLFSKLNGGPFSWQFQMAGKGWQPRLAPNTHVTCPSSEQTQPSIGRYYVISLALNANMQWIGTVLAKIRTICGKIATFAAHQRRKGRKPARKAKGEVGRCGERAVPRNWEIRSEEYVWRCWRWWCCWCCW